MLTWRQTDEKVAWSPLHPDFHFVSISGILLETSGLRRAALLSSFENAVTGFLDVPDNPTLLASELFQDMYHLLHRGQCWSLRCHDLDEKPTPTPFWWRRECALTIYPFPARIHALLIPRLGESAADVGNAHCERTGNVCF